MRNDNALAPADQALLMLLQRLAEADYDFVTPTPVTHRRVLARAHMQRAHDLRGALGWSLPFAAADMPADIVQLLRAGGVLEDANGLLKSTVRVSGVRELLFLHSAFPTDQADAVFLGPDSYRFADFLAAELAGRSWIGRLLDIGGGAGVGALTAAAGRSATQVALTDVNPAALRLARINAAHAGVPLEAILGSGVDGAPPTCDLILANPPYIGGGPDQTYQDGGDLHGGRISLDWARAAIPRLAPGGRLLLYTGSAILEGGRDQLRDTLAAVADAAGARFAYRELDPDVFGEELEKPAYADVERIAAVGCVITKPREGERQS